MERTCECSNCHAEITYTDKDIVKKSEYEEQLPFSRIFKVYVDVRVKCPKCGETFVEKKIFQNDVIYHGAAHHIPKHREPV